MSSLVSAGPTHVASLSIWRVKKLEQEKQINLQSDDMPRQAENHRHQNVNDRRRRGNLDVRTSKRQTTFSH